MKYYLIAGEASGDLHGSNLVKEIMLLDPLAEIRCWGGNLMQAAGATLVKHYRDLAFMGFVEVIKNLPTIFRNLKFCKADIAAWQPDVLVLIDYPGFNLRIAKWAHSQQVKTVYYISPQVWAWKENRVTSIKVCVDKMLVILPFEKDFYRKWNYEVEYVGHPLIEVIRQFRAQPRIPFSWETGNTKGCIAIMPGSRQQEIAKKLPIMLKVCKAFPDYTFVVAKAPGLADDFYDSFLTGYDNVQSVSNQTYALLSASSAALVTSGTATLETALFGVPEVVCYKGNPVSYQLAKRLIKVKYISLVNLIMDKLVVRELIQDELSPENLIKELEELLHNENRRRQLAEDYSALTALLSQGGNASAKAAQSIAAFLLAPEGN
jgi:lipid-A-disaccharide synthase